MLLLRRQILGGQRRRRFVAGLHLMLELGGILGVIVDHIADRIPVECRADRPRSFRGPVGREGGINRGGISAYVEEYSNAWRESCGEFLCRSPE